MKDLNEIIENGREEFEADKLPSGHKERFLNKLKQSKTENKTLVQKNFKRAAFYLAAASVLAFLVISPVFFNSNESLECPAGVADYKTLLKERSDNIYLMLNKLEPNDKEMVINTLAELTNETVPFENQLPDDMEESQKSQLKQQYYCPKIQGIESLSRYVAQLIKN